MTIQAMPKDSAAKMASLEPLIAMLSDEMTEVNKEIIAHMHSPIALIPQLAGHIVAAGGKRIRPMLTLAAARLCGYEGKRHIGLAACVEFIHTATLLHDDVVDESAKRRGKDTANAIWGNQASVLVGDFLFSRSFQLMTADGSLEVLTVLSEASATIAEGEVYQLMTANDISTSEEAYLEVIHGKTAALFAAACEVGALVADQPAEKRQALRDYGASLGMAFQLVDDVLDYAAEEGMLGKSVGDDFREGKMTLPIVIAHERGSAEEQAFWKRCIEDLDQHEGDLERALELLAKTGALSGAMERAETYANKAIASLDGFPNAPVKDAMIEAVEFCIQRAY